MSMHALRLTGARTAPRWLRGEGKAMRADAWAVRPESDDRNALVRWAMEASLRLHNALPRIADEHAAEQVRTTVDALDEMIRLLRRRSLPDSSSGGARHPAAD